MDKHWIVFGFLSYCALLARFGVPSDRRGWSVLAWFAFANFILNWALLDRIDSDWIHVIAAGVEFLTIRTLLVLSWNSFGKRQSLILGLFFACHLGLYVDINSGTSLIYNHYETAILALLVCQMALGFTGIKHVFRNVDRAIFRNRASGVHGFELDLDTRRLHKGREEGEKERTPRKE